MPVRRLPIAAGARKPFDHRVVWQTWADAASRRLPIPVTSHAGRACLDDLIRSAIQRNRSASGTTARQSSDSPADLALRAMRAEKTGGNQRFACARAYAVTESAASAPVLNGGGITPNSRIRSVRPSTWCASDSDPAPNPLNQRCHNNAATQYTTSASDPCQCRQARSEVIIFQLA